MSIIHQMILKKNQKAGAQFRPINQEAQRELSETMNLMTSHPQEYLLHFLHAMERITDSILKKPPKKHTITSSMMHSLYLENGLHISMGTIINNQPEFYQKCFVGLKISMRKLSIGKQLTVEQLGDIPDNFIVGNYLPQLDILRQADVFISHCGMNSTSESLYGAGFMLNIQQLLAEDLKHAVNEVLQHSIYKENAKN